MEIREEVARELLYEFLHRWPAETLSTISPKQYVAIGDCDTFCQWLETRTKAFGSIKGVNLIKFGIYKRGPFGGKQKLHSNDEKYTWQK